MKNTMIKRFGFNEDASPHDRREHAIKEMNDFLKELVWPVIDARIVDDGVGNAIGYDIDYDGPPKTAVVTGKHEAFAKAAQPLLDFLNEYCCPHDIVIIQQGDAQLFNGEIGLPFPVPD